MALEVVKLGILKFVSGVAPRMFAMMSYASGVCFAANPSMTGYGP